MTDESKLGDGLPSVVPDLIEQDHPEFLDNAIPGRGYQLTPMVGLGGSAGSIQALTEFFKAMTSDSGMAFVVVLHLSPNHHSTLPDLLGRSTSMSVVPAHDGQTVEPNHVYVIPPGKYLVTLDGHLQLTDLEQERGKRVAVDLFFRSLADTHGPSAMAIVLSGADGDGALGIKRIKERGGLTVAQDPDQAEYPGMPQAAIETGMIDWVLKVGQIPGRLIEYRDNGRRIKLPREDGPLPTQPQPNAEDAEAALREVLIYLRTRTGRDFSYYKRATILRRIARRMQVNGLENLPAYLSFLRLNTGEAGALLQDLLISVTNFFRDRDAFSALEAYLPDLFKNKSASDSIRVWVPACATGEEAYSIAMLLVEYTRGLEDAPSLQVFASDLDDEAIQTARAGHYPNTITADVSNDRLQRFFVKEHLGYRIRRELREIVLFATHDLLKDAPFSRMDLISCRNLLIYLNREAQHRVFDIFHFALRPSGRLFLGSSEAVDEGSPLFSVLDKKYRIYSHRAVLRTDVPVPTGPSSLLRVIEAQQALATPPIHGKRFAPDTSIPFHTPLRPNLDRAALAELHFRLVERLAPPSMIVDAENEIVHLSEHAGEFLQFVGGEPSTDLMRVIHPSLRTELRTALFRAAETKAPVHSSEVPAEINGRSMRVDICVMPAHEIAPGHLLVTFDKHENSDDREKSEGHELPAEPLVRHLERDLERIKLHLRDTVEQYEASTEELKASNEELQAMNEELRSATEELETGREELQSINEELTTVNLEMKGKVDELAHANSDLHNLMASTAIATVFLNRELAIMLYTPSATEIFHIIPGDVGRPLAHLKHRLDYPGLIADAEEVIRTLVPIEREIHDDSHIYLARLQPYRTLQDQIAGVVLTLVDVTERNRATEALRRSEERMRLLLESAKDYAIFTIDCNLHIDSWNSGAEAMFGYAEAEIIGQLIDVLFTPDDRDRGEAAREIRTAREGGRAENQRWYSREDGSVFYGSGSVMPLRDHDGGLRGFVKIMCDLTESKRMQEALSEHVDELKRFNNVAVGREIRMIELKKEINDLFTRLGEPRRYTLLENADENEAREP